LTVRTSKDHVLIIRSSRRKIHTTKTQKMDIGAWKLKNELLKKA
jgi:hypothetical protein